MRRRNGSNVIIETRGTDGTIVRDARSHSRRRAEGGARGALAAGTDPAGGAPRGEVEIGHGVPPGAITAVLGHAGEVLIRKQVTFDGERPVRLATTYIPAFVEEAAPRTADLDTGEGGIVSRMADAGLAQAYVIEDIEQALATAEAAEALGVTAGDPLLAITHIARCEDGRVVEVTRHELGSGWKLRYGVPLD